MNREHCSEIAKAYDIFQDSLLSDETSICFLGVEELSNQLEERILNESELRTVLEVVYLFGLFSPAVLTAPRRKGLAVDQCSCRKPDYPSTCELLMC